MPDLLHTLQGNDLGFLKMVAGAWGLDLPAADAATGLPLLAGGMLNRGLVNEIIEALPAGAQSALQELIENEGRLSWAVFTRRFGEVRTFGAARRDRERPDLRPVSAAEVLWYRGLVGRAFLNLPPEPQEYAYIPDDLLELINPMVAAAPPPLGRPASPGESAHPIPASDRILDHACTLLAALRLGQPLEQIDASGWRLPPATLLELLDAADLLDHQRVPAPEPTRAFLEASRGQALAHLSRAWADSPRFNELRLLPGLKFEGEWRNDPLQARQAILGLLSQLPGGPWWNLASFVNGVAERAPDFQRPAGDYDSWFIRREVDGVYLRGIGHWDEVDGALVRSLICGPLHALGWYDLASAEPGGPVTAFRPTPMAADLWHGQPPPGLPVENQPVRISAEGVLRLAPLAPRAVRYQMARFGLWDGETAEEYRYRLTPASLERARQQGLRTSHLVGLLKKHAGGAPLPPALLQAFDRWEKYGAQATFEPVQILRLGSPEILTALRQHTRIARYLGETLNPTTIIVKPGGTEAIQRALAELGYLADGE